MSSFGKTSVWTGAVAVVAMVGCGQGHAPGTPSKSAALGNVDAVSARLAATPIAGLDDLPPGMAGTMVGGRPFVYAHIEGSPTAVRGLVQASGGRVQSTIGRYVTATLPLGAVAGLSRDPAVTRVELGKKVRLYNDLGNLAAGNASRASALEAAPPYASANGNGAGVVVCAVDTGIDVTHPDFIRPDGTSRVFRYWDQSDLTDTNAPQPYGFGREYGATEIQAAAGGGAAVARDTHGHGTHVMGTIAGNGRGGTTTDAGYLAHYGAYQFTGVAPAADIAFVKFDFDGSRNTDTAIVQGVEWCTKVAAGRPVVVNLSLGTDFGPHDGTTLEERQLDLLAGPGKLILAAAGNAGEVGTMAADVHSHLPPAAPIHGTGTLAEGGTSTVSFNLKLNALGRMKGRNNDYIFFTLWYPGGVVTDVEVTTPSGAKVTSAAWRTGQAGAGLLTASGAVSVYNAPSPTGEAIDWGSTSGDRELYLEISDATGARDVAEGTWTVTLKGVSGSGAYHGWHGLSDNFRGTPVSYEGHATDNVMTVGAPATAANLIAVGAYATRGDGLGTANENVWWITGVDFRAYTGATFPVTLGDLAFFSSRGPDRHGRVLPHITAPGVGIISSRSKDATFTADYLIAGGRYVTMQGTSMSTPNAAGSVALALARNPALDPAALRAGLAASARRDGYVNNTLSGFTSDHSCGGPCPAPNNDWGPGKLDVPGLLAATACAPTEDVEVSCDGVDNDCDGAVDEGLTNACGGCAPFDAALLGAACGTCGTNVCSGGALTCDDPGANACGVCGPAPAETCNGSDDDCDGLIDEDQGTVSCGVGACTRTVNACADGAPQTCTPGAPAAELCADGIDNDCDGLTDAADPDCPTVCKAKGGSCGATAECCSGLTCKGGRCR